MAGKTAEVIKSDSLLPDDLIRDILLRLPAKFIIRFRSVSKSWLAITTDPSFLLAHSGRSPISRLIHTTTNQSHESHLRSIKLRLLSPAPTPSDNGIVVSSVLPERRRSTTDVVFACCDGLICLRDRIRETLEQEDAVPCYYVINPLTGAHIDVPKPRLSLGHLMGLYLHPPTGEYRLIRRTNSDIINNTIELITLGGDSWRMIRSSPPKEMASARLPIDLKGYLFWIAYNLDEFNASVVLVFDTTEEEFKLMPLPARERRQYTNHSLFQMGERLGISIIDRELSSASELGIDIWALKDRETVEWEKMYSVRCSGGLQMIDFRFGYSVDDIALMVKEEMSVLFIGPRSYLVRFDLSSMKYRTEEVTDPEDIIWHFSLLHKETLISYDSFRNG